MALPNFTISLPINVSARWLSFGWLIKQKYQFRFYTSNHSENKNIAIKYFEKFITNKMQVNAFYYNYFRLLVLF